ncbi:hypothetical protein NUW54_g6826 [Trametes sanguinea]|uniref:Uncharacterized protein n=1 Tax=Trametes sanguinea TaxID=158606 RepID=A0ACC1PSL1_9APHY|nr:hypothetical protein NUW54_g6826 [Trametes sanguinea]
MWPFCSTIVRYGFSLISSGILDTFKFDKSTPLEDLFTNLLVLLGYSDNGEMSQNTFGLWLWQEQPIGGTLLLKGGRPQVPTIRYEPADSSIASRLVGLSVIVRPQRTRTYSHEDTSIAQGCGPSLSKHSPTRSDSYRELYKASTHTWIRWQLPVACASHCIKLPSCSYRLPVAMSSGSKAYAPRNKGKKYRFMDTDGKWYVGILVTVIESIDGMRAVFKFGNGEQLNVRYLHCYETDGR